MPSELGQNSISVVVTDVNGNVSSCTAVVTVLDTIVPVSFAGADTTVCGVSSMNLNASPVLIGQIGSWSCISSFPVSITSPADPYTQISGLSNGVYLMVWSVSNGNGCAIDRDTVEINAIQSLSAIADPDITLCNQYSLNLSALPTPNGVLGVWIAGSGTPSIPSVTPTSPTLISISNLVEGTYPFYWKVSNGVCPDVYDTVLVDVYDQPISTVGPDQVLCGKYSTTLSGNQPSGRAKGNWFFLAPRTGSTVIPTIVNDSLGNSLVTGLVEGNYQFAWRVSNGVCFPSFDTLTVSVYDQPIANAGSDTLLCGVDSVLLFAVPPVGLASGFWSIDTVVAMAPVPTLRDSSSFATMANGLEFGGNQQFIWTVSNGVCPASKDTMLVSVLERPIVDAGIDSSYCAQYTIQVNAFPIAQPSVGSWTIDSSSAPNFPSIANSNNPSTAVSGLIEGIYHFIWRGQNLPCFDISDTVTIIISNQYLANAGPDISLCDEDSVAINANSIVGTATTKWMLESSFPNFPSYDSLNSSSYVSNMVQGGVYSMVWEIRNGVCPVSRDTGK